MFTRIHRHLLRRTMRYNTHLYTRHNSPQLTKRNLTGHTPRTNHHPHLISRHIRVHMVNVIQPSRRTRRAFRIIRHTLQFVASHLRNLPNRHQVINTHMPTPVKLSSSSQRYIHRRIVRIAHSTNTFNRHHSVTFLVLFYLRNIITLVRRTSNSTPNPLPMHSSSHHRRVRNSRSRCNR